MAVWIYYGGTFLATMLCVYAMMFVKEATASLGPFVSFVAGGLTLVGSMAVLAHVLIWGAFFALMCASGRPVKSR